MFLFTSLGLHVNCEALILLILSAEKKENLNFGNVCRGGALFYCTTFLCFVDALNRLMSRL